MACLHTHIKRVSSVYFSLPESLRSRQHPLLISSLIFSLISSLIFFSFFFASLAISSPHQAHTTTTTSLKQLDRSLAGVIDVLRAACADVSTLIRKEALSLLSRLLALRPAHEPLQHVCALFILACADTCIWGRSS